MAQEKRAIPKNRPWGSVVIHRGAGERFYSRVRPPSSIYVLLEGRVSVSRLTREGRQLVTEILEPGSVYGDLSLGAASSDNEFAEALTSSRALAVDSRRARALIASDSELTLRFVHAVARRLSAACDRIEEFAYQPAETRIASAVLQVAGRSGRTALVSHQFLADMAGTYRETATRLLDELQMKKLVELNRCAIKIMDSEALTAVASGRATGRKARRGLS